ncbi:MAG: YbjQ family protein [Caldilineaceae bacterium]|jgi:uncharacterized protein YbjQ (UPF0145 family)
MLMTTTDQIPGRDIGEILGIAIGSTIRARNVGSDVLAGLRNVVGGEVTQYTSLMSEAREQAIQRMLEEAESLHADAVIGVRLTTSNVANGAAEIVAYGTAVKLAY